MLHLEAPAQGALEYQVRKFNNGVNNTIYQGIPSPEVDKAWTDLYNGMKAISLFSQVFYFNPPRRNWSFADTKITSEALAQ